MRLTSFVLFCFLIQLLIVTATNTNTDSGEDFMRNRSERGLNACISSYSQFQDVFPSICEVYAFARKLVPVARVSLVCVGWGGAVGRGDCTGYRPL